MAYDDVVSYYEAYREDLRLLAGAGRLEFERTRDILKRCLPPAPALILDVGGGPGAYSCWLAAEGYEVHLLDPVPSHIEQARLASARQPSHPIATFQLGDARALPHADGSADAALLMGPMYHLTESDDRARTLGEARRVLRDGGVLVAAGICRFASLLDGLARGLIDDPRFPPIVRQDLACGQHRNPTENPEFFTSAFFHRPEELAAEVQGAGFRWVRVVAVEGLGWVAADLEARLTDAARCEQLLGLLREVESDPALLGASPHLLATAIR